MDAGGKISGKLQQRDFKNCGENFCHFCGMLWCLIYSDPQASLQLPTVLPMEFTKEPKAAIKRKQISKLAI